MPAFIAIDSEAVCAAYRAGEGQSSIAARLGVSAGKVNKTIIRNIPADERNTLRRARLLAGGPVRSRRIQAAKIAAHDVIFARKSDCLTYRLHDKCFIFDLQDEGLLRNYAWRLASDGRLLRQVGKPGGGVANIYVYHDILGVEPSRNLVVDHINRDPSDNRRRNLRLCSPSENALNRGPRLSHGAADSSNGDHDYA